VYLHGSALRLPEESRRSVVARVIDAYSVIPTALVRQLERNSALVVGQGDRMDVYAVIESVREHILPQERHVLRRRLKHPGFPGVVTGQGKAGRGADIRARIEESAAFEPTPRHADPPELIHYPREQCALVSPASEGLTRHLSVGCTEVEA
jgi:hypothetical protein